MKKGFRRKERCEKKGEERPKKKKEGEGVDSSLMARPFCALRNCTKK